MSLIKYNPRRYRTQGVNKYFDDLLNDNFFKGNSTGENSFVPQVDIAETDKQFEIQFAIPGIDKKDLTIDLNDGVLTVSGERKVQNEKDEKNYHSIEASIRHAVERSENISYVFSGSNRHLLKQMFGGQGRPLYRLCQTSRGIGLETAIHR